MTEEQFKKAQDMLEQIEKYERMSKALDESAKKVKEGDDVEKVAQLLIEILKSDDGVAVFDYIVQETQRILTNAKNFCERIFSEL